MHIYKLLPISLSMLFSCYSIAGTMGSVEAVSGARVITLSFGPAWTDPGKTRTFFLQPDIEKTYAANNNSKAIPFGEIFFAFQKSLSSLLTGQIGFAAALSGTTHLIGDIWEDADPDFNNYIYQYKLNHAHAAVKAKLIANTPTFVQPYVTGSAGIAFNRTSKFHITPKIFEEVPAPPFSSHNEASFMYNLGVGVQKSLTTNWQAGVGYEFADWGQSKLARAPGQTTNSGIRLNHYYANELVFSISYVG